MSSTQPLSILQPELSPATPPAPWWERQFGVALAAASVLLLVQVWLSTGTMAPYAATLVNPLVTPEGYLVNYDHQHYEAIYRYVRGESPGAWHYGIVLRRVLFFLLAFPFMAVFGFLRGGVAASMLVNVAAFASFVWFMRKRVGIWAGYAAMVLLCSYPGITYWAGLPYAHAMIVPATLWATMLMDRMHRTRSPWRLAGLALVIGVLFTAYDLFIFFLPAVVLLLVFTRKAKAVPGVVAAMALPSVLVNVLLVARAGTARSDNTRIFGSILNAYLHPSEFARWLGYVKDLPKILFFNYFDTGFWFFSGLFLVLYVLGRFRLGLRLNAIERALFAAVVLLFFFLNLAPHYEDWQMRGVWISRLYQPIFAVIVSYAARLAQAVASEGQRIRAQFAVAALVGATFLLNLGVTLGPSLQAPPFLTVYARFYVNGPVTAFGANLGKYGRRPLGL